MLLLAFLEALIGYGVELFSLAGVAGIFPGSGNHVLNRHFLLQFEEVAAAGEDMLIEKLFGIACQGVPVARGGFIAKEVHILAQELFEDIATFGVVLELFAIQVGEAAYVAGFGHDLCLAFHSGQHEVGAVIAAAAFELCI